MLYKLYVVFVLLFIAYPARCLPVMTLGTVAGDVAERSGWKRRGSDSSVTASIVAFLIGTSLSAVAIYLFGRRLRSINSSTESADVGGLGRTSWLILMWTGLVIGMGVGAYFSYLFLTM